MLILIKNEIVKLLMRKKTLVVTLGFAALIGLILYGSYREARNAKQYESVEFRINNLQASIDYTERRKDNIPGDIKDNSAKVEEYKANIDSEVEEMKKQLEELKNLNGKDLDWRQELKLNISNLEQQVKTDVQVDERTRSEWKLQLDKLKYLQEHDIKPVKDYDITSFNFLNSLVMIIGSVFLAIGVVVFVSDMVSGECTPPTLKVLLTQPVSRGKILLSKFIAVTVTSSVLILAVELLYFVIIGFIFGFGNAQYPMMVGSRYEYDMTTVLSNGTNPLTLIAGSAAIVPAWKYTIELMLLELLFIAACTAFAFLLSSVLKSSMVSMAVSIVSIIASLVMIEAVSSLKKVAAYLFVAYGDVTSILSGKVAVMFGNPNLTIPVIVVILTAWIVVCYAVSHVIFTKKDILI